MAFLSVMADRLEQWLPIPKGLHKFIAVGLIGLLVHTSVFSLLLYSVRLDRSLAWVCGLVVATSVTWGLNRRMTFASSGRKLHHEAARYILVTLVAQSVSFVVFQTLSRLVPAAPAPADVIFGAAVATIFSYLGNRHFTFAPLPNRTAEVHKH